jgi:hypothetical protein
LGDALAASAELVGGSGPSALFFDRSRDPRKYSRLFKDLIMVPERAPFG